MSHTVPMLWVCLQGQTQTEPQAHMPSTPSQEGICQTLQEMELLVPPQAGPPHEGRCGSGFSVLAPPPKTFLWDQGTCLGHQTLQASPACWGAKPGAEEAMP